MSVYHAQSMPLPTDTVNLSVPPIRKDDPMLATRRALRRFYCFGFCAHGLAASVACWASILSACVVNAADEAKPVAEGEVKFDEASLEFFESKVRPILSSCCYECHGPDRPVKGGLRMDSRAAILAGGDTGAAAVPKQPKQSLFIDAINYGDVYQMPPKGKLPPAEKRRR